MKRKEKVHPSLGERLNASLAKAEAALSVIELAVDDLYEAAVEQESLSDEAFELSENYDGVGKSLLSESANNNDAAKRLEALLATIK